ncbi:MAG TPA: LysM peptidoglycan-binding domain-containing protein [Nocardioides sp.]|nr:LysM peptidoglycan-binding domain-containing protein [Nocardioides sp.]
MSTMTATTIRPTSTVRLTRRGRLVVFALALLVVLTVGLVLASGSVATDEPGTPEPTRVVLVGSGDTLWDIASGLADDGDVRAMVDRIQRLNALDSGMVVAGQKLVVPLG